MQGTIQSYVLYMADDVKKEPLKVKQCDTNSRWAKITLKAFEGEYWLIPFDVQIYLNVHKADGTLATATCTKIDEHTVLAPITEQMTAVTGTQSGELYFLAPDGDIKSQTFPIAVYPMVMDQARIESSDDFQSLQEALRDVKVSTEAADIAAQYATEQGNQARDGAQRANDAADSIQVAVDAAANAKACESNAKDSETAAAQTQQAVTDYVEAQKAAFVGYSQRESDSKYANALTETSTGEGDITVEDAWTAPVLGLEVMGRSEQAVTTGAQLLLQPQFNDTKNGITVKTQTDGGISITGTATAAITFTVAEILILAGDYTLSGLSGLVVGRMYFQLVEISAQGGQFVGELAKVGHVASTTITIDRDVWARAEIKVLSGVTADSVCYPMLNAGTTALPWEPYTGSAPSPSPEYPQDIISTGTVSTGAQLLNADTIVQGMISTETGAESESSVFVRSDYIPVKPGDYILSGDGLKPYFNHVMYFSKEKVILSSLSIKPTNGKFTVADETAYIRIRFISKDGTSGTVTPSEVAALKPMLNTGDTALPWEPYTGGKPSPSVEYPQTLEVGVTGAQLFYKSLVTLQGTGAEADITDKRAIKITYTRANGGKYAGFIVDDKINIIGKTLTISYSGIVSSKSGLTPGIRLYWIDNNGSVLSYVVYVNKSPTTITIEDPQNDMATKLALLLYADIGDAAVVNDYVIYKDIMINAGDIPLPWEPYMGCQNAAITLTEPLRGIGDYRDRIMCRDGEWGIERSFAESILNGNDAEGWNIQDSAIEGKKRFTSRMFENVIKRPENNASLSPMVCSYLKVQTPNGGHTMAEGICVNTSGRIILTSDSLATLPIAEFQAWLSAHPITVIYPLATPAWEPLPDATQQALNALTTYAGTTHLTITAGGPAPTVTLNYVKDTHKALEQCQEAAKEYTDNQIAAIVAALPTATQAAIVDNQTTRLLQEV